MHIYKPEGLPAGVPTIDALRRGAGTGEVFQARCTKCDEFHNLHVDLGGIRGLIPREEAALGMAEGKIREIAILSRVGKGVCFQVLAFDSRGTAILSRRAAQAEAKEFLLNTLRPGDVLPAVVQNAPPFGVFCDIGCGVNGLMRIDRCCVSRLDSAALRFKSGQNIYAAVAAIDQNAGQIHLPGRELLGTWADNAARFRQGQTVPGTVRSVMPYGVFVELTPNLSGLAETDLPVQPNDTVSVYLRAIQHDRHKIKLNILEILPPCPPEPMTWFITEGRLEKWEYFPGSTAVTYF